MEEVFKILPDRLQKAVTLAIKNKQCDLEEIRIRLGQPLELVFSRKYKHIKKCYVTKDECSFILNRLSKYSLYRFERELKEGFITIRGGHRVGIAGSVNTINGQIEKINHVRFFNIRIAKQKLGSAKKLVKTLYNDKYASTLIIGPPKSGKTTVLRDIARTISTGWNEQESLKVGIIDERSEIAAANDGIPQHDVGPRTDVLDGCPKTDGLMMFIRSMSPEVLIVDEIGHEQDMKALLEALYAGIKVICTAHGDSLTQLKQRPSFENISLENIFKYVVILCEDPYPGTVKEIYHIVNKQFRLMRSDQNCENHRRIVNYRSNDLDGLYL